MKINTPSIKQIFSRTNKLMLGLAIIPLLISAFLYTRQIYMYQKIVANIQEANIIEENSGDVVLENMWDLVFGQVSVHDYSQQNMLNHLRMEINDIKQNTTTFQEKSTLDVATRTLDTLENYQDQIIENLETGHSIDKNEEIMIQVDSVTQLLSDILQTFVQVEIGLASKKNEELFHSLIAIASAEIFIVAAIVYFVYKNDKFQIHKIHQPLNRLIHMADELSKGNLSYRMALPDTVELRSLTERLNAMADDLTTLLEENALKQYHLAQSEVRVLQAQITPHFIYNSLDAILSLIEQHDYEKAKETTYALSDFFRISLSKGNDWITVNTELKHIEDYLIILKIRYGEMLDYQIDASCDIQEYKILKMVLQPLIENAIYHGTKHTRRQGFIHVSVREQQDSLIFKIKDNGIGILPERLAEIQEELKNGLDSEFTTGYGLYNVNKRLLLYYGRSAGIQLESSYNVGTTVTLTVPKRQEEQSHV